MGDTGTWTGIGTYPRVTSALALDSATVQIIFNASMENTAELRTAARYLFNIDLIASSVIVINDTTVNVTVTGTMHHGTGNYTVTITPTTGIVDIGDNELDPAHNSATFDGVSATPRVSSASMVDATHVYVVFDKAMLNTAELRTASRYTFIGPTIITAASVSVIDAETVSVEITGTTEAHITYTVAVGPPYTGIEDTDSNELDPAHHTTTFTGFSTAPQLYPTVGLIDAYSFYITYTAPMNIAEAITPSNYSIVPALGAITITEISTTVFQVTTENSGGGISHTITVNGVHDQWGSLINPLHNSATFIFLTPPTIYHYPEDKSADINPREFIRVQAVDLPPEHTGIDTTTWNVYITYTIGTQAIRFDALVAGVPNTTVFDYEFTGDASDASTGITFKFRPRAGLWIFNQLYTVHSSVADLDGNVANLQTVVTFGSAQCFEDDIPTTLLGLEELLLTQFVKYPACEQLRRLMLTSCTKSGNFIVRARTLMWHCMTTDLATIMATVFDPATVQNVRLCNRTSTVEIYALLKRYRKVVLAALDEIRQLVGSTVVIPIEQYVNSTSPIYVVSSAASLVVLAAISQG